MINKVLQDLINIGKVVSFIDNVIIGMETEEVVKRLAENGLYVKPEKCKWKVKEVRFLEVVIESERIKIEVKDVLDWPIPKKVKDIQNFLVLANYYH